MTIHRLEGCSIPNVIAEVTAGCCVTVSLARFKEAVRIFFNGSILVVTRVAV